jgi:cell division protein FtsL
MSGANLSTEETVGLKQSERSQASTRRRERTPPQSRRKSDADSGGVLGHAMGFFWRALELVPDPMKFLVFLAVVMILAPQAVRGTENPTLSLIFIFVCILMFALFAAWIELRNRQILNLRKEIEALQNQLREVVQQKSSLDREVDLLKENLRDVAQQRRSLAAGNRTKKVSNL